MEGMADGEDGVAAILEVDDFSFIFDFDFEDIGPGYHSAEEGRLSWPSFAYCDHDVVELG